MIKVIQHQEIKDVLESANYIRGPFVGEDSREWKVLAERLGRRPMKCFELELDVTKIRVSAGVVHSVYYPPQSLTIQRPCVVWLSYTATFPVGVYSNLGTPFLYRKPGPSSVVAAVIKLPIGDEPFHFNDGSDPSFLINARKLGTVTRNGRTWALEGGSGIYPVSIPALGGFNL